MTTPAEKDAMALAVLDKWSDTEERRCNHKSPGKCSVCIQRREARAHLASRIAELEAERNEYRVGAEIARGMLDRAEAELVAVRARPRQISACILMRPMIDLWRKQDPVFDAAMRKAEAERAAIDAARGVE